MIKFCSIVSIISLILLYVSIANTEVIFIINEYVCTSNDFVMTLFGGIFASIITVGMCEFRKYLTMKENTENYLFYQGFYLYQALVQLIQNIEDYKKHPEWPISDNLLDESMKMIQCEVISIQRTDYVTFWAQRNVMIKIHERFRMERLPNILFLRSGILLRLAINEEKLNYLQNDMSPPANFTSANVKLFQTLNDVLVKADSYAMLVDGYISTLDDYCSNRFKYKTMKSDMVIPHIKM